MKLRLDLRLSQKLIMTPQLQQAIKLLQLSRLELQQTLTQHLMENPLLEELQTDADETTDEYSQDKPEASGDEAPSEAPGQETAETVEEQSPSSWEDYFDSDRRAGDTEYPASSQDEFPSYDQTVVKAQSLEDHLLWQLALSGVSDADKGVGRLLIGNVDDDGYLRTPIAEIASEAGVSAEKVESVLGLIHTFDPAGVGARDLQECLMIQLGFLDRNVGIVDGRRIRLKGSLVEGIVRQHLKDLEKKHYSRIAKALNATTEEVFAAAKIIEALEPKPGRPYYQPDNYVIVPDVFVVKNEGEWVVLLNDDGMPRLRITPYYKQMIGGGKS